MGESKICGYNAESVLGERQLIVKFVVIMLKVLQGKDKIMYRVEESDSCKYLKFNAKSV